MKQCRALLTRLRYRIEISTGLLWGADTHYAEYPHPLAYLQFNPKSSGYVRVEGGVGSHGYYLSWGHR